MVIASEQPNIPVILFYGNPAKELELNFSRLEGRIMVWFDECHYVVQGVKEVVQKKRAIKPYFRKNERY